MEKLVYVPADAEHGDVLRRAREKAVDGVEIDVTGFSEEQFAAVQEAVRNEGVAVRSLHDDRPQTIAIGEEDLFLRHVSTVLEWAADLDASHVSVHPPRVAVGEAHTVRDVERFLSRVNAHVKEYGAGFGFALDGFLREPELINTAFREAETDAIGISVDLGRFVEGIDPATIVEKLSVPVQKMRIPVRFHQLDTVAREAGDMYVVAEKV